jgi:hypothetical protein
MLRTKSRRAATPLGASVIRITKSRRNKASRWDGAEVIATFGVRKDVSAIATIVVFAVLVGMPNLRGLVPPDGKGARCERTA